MQACICTRKRLPRTVYLFVTERLDFEHSTDLLHGAFQDRFKNAFLTHQKLALLRRDAQYLPSSSNQQ